MDGAGVKRVLARHAAVLAPGVAAVVGWADTAGAIGGLIAADIDDTGATRRVQLIAAGLALAGLAVAGMTIWWWRSTKPHHESLGPLEVMSARRWAERPANQQSESLDAARPQAGTQPSTATPSIDLSALAAARSLPSVHDGGGFGDLADLAVPADGARAGVFNQADHTDWTAARPLLADSLAAAGPVEASRSSTPAGVPAVTNAAAPDAAPSGQSASLAALVRGSAPFAGLRPSGNEPDSDPDRDPANVVGRLLGREVPSATTATGSGPVASTAAVVDIGNVGDAVPPGGAHPDHPGGLRPAPPGDLHPTPPGADPAFVVPPPERLNELPFRPFRRAWGAEQPLPPPEAGAAVEVDLDSSSSVD